jgi:competence ComEA-like helix-hairpin-helix protein
MNLSRDETRALGFVALLLALSATVRFIDRPRHVALDAAGVDIVALEAASRAAATETRPQALGMGERIDPNTARLQDLLRLPRMTKRIAGSILSMREGAPFRTLEDLDRVPGVGPAALKSWEPHLKLPAGLAAPVAAGDAPRKTNDDQPLTSATPLRLNTATAEELERLPGIGPSLAARIIAWRDSAGLFRNVEDIAKVRGIGPATLARLKPLLTL